MLKRIEETITHAVTSINHLLKVNRKELIYQIGKRVKKVENSMIYYIQKLVMKMTFLLKYLNLA